MLTPERLRAIKDRCERATEGPWWVDGDPGYAERSRASLGKIDGVLIWGPPGETVGGEAANARFVAHAREDVPALVEEVERLWDFVDELRNELRRWRDRAAELERSAGMDAEDELDESWREGKAAGLDEAADELEVMLKELEANRRAE